MDFTWFKDYVRQSVEKACKVQPKSETDSKDLKEHSQSCCEKRQGTCDWCRLFGPTFAQAHIDPKVFRFAVEKALKKTESIISKNNTTWHFRKLRKSSTPETPADLLLKRILRSGQFGPDLERIIFTKLDLLENDRLWDLLLEPGILGSKRANDIGSWLLIRGVPLSSKTFLDILQANQKDGFPLAREPIGGAKKWNIFSPQRSLRRIKLVSLLPPQQRRGFVELLWGDVLPTIRGLTLLMLWLMIRLPFESRFATESPVQKMKEMLQIERIRVAANKDTLIHLCVVDEHGQEVAHGSASEKNILLENLFAACYCGDLEAAMTLGLCLVRRHEASLPSECWCFLDNPDLDFETIDKMATWCMVSNIPIYVEALARSFFVSESVVRVMGLLLATFDWTHFSQEQDKTRYFIVDIRTPKEREAKKILSKTLPSTTAIAIFQEILKYICPEIPCSTNEGLNAAFGACSTTHIGYQCHNKSCTQVELQHVQDWQNWWSIENQLALYECKRCKSALKGVALEQANSGERSVSSMSWKSFKKAIHTYFEIVGVEKKRPPVLQFAPPRAAPSSTFSSLKEEQATKERLRAALLQKEKEKETEKQKNARLKKVRREKTHRRLGDPLDSVNPVKEQEAQAQENKEEQVSEVAMDCEDGTTLNWTLLQLPFGRVWACVAPEVDPDSIFASKLEPVRQIRRQNSDAPQTGIKTTEGVYYLKVRGCDDRLFSPLWSLQDLCHNKESRLRNIGDFFCGFLKGLGEDNKVVSLLFFDTRGSHMTFQTCLARCKTRSSPVRCAETQETRKRQKQRRGRRRKDRKSKMSQSTLSL